MTFENRHEKFFLPTRQTFQNWCQSESRRKEKDCWFCWLIPTQKVGKDNIIANKNCSAPNQVKTRSSWQTLKITGFKWKTLRPFRQKRLWNFFLFRDQSAKSFRSWALSNQIILSVCRFLSCHFWQIKLRQDNLRVKGVRHI